MSLLVNYCKSYNNQDPYIKASGWLEFAKKILKLAIGYNTHYDNLMEIHLELIKRMVSDKEYFKKNQKINFLNSCLFVVEDINVLINNIKNNGYPSINEGVQSNRGEVNQADEFLSDIESDYLDSLYNHYMYMFSEDEKYALSRFMFSKSNIRKISYSEVQYVSKSILS